MPELAAEVRRTLPSGGRLRSGGEHCHLELAVEELAVEVRRGTLSRLRRRQRKRRGGGEEQGSRRKNTNDST